MVKQLKFPIHIDNTVDKWCNHCGREMKKKLIKTVRYNGSTGQEIVSYDVRYKCPREGWIFADWNHQRYLRDYSEVEA